MLRVRLDTFQGLKMPITDWPEQERPREKLLNRGAGALSDAELLAIFLRTGSKGITAVDLARSLLKQFGSINGLLGANKKEFCQAHGLGPAKYSQLQAVVEMTKRHLRESLNNKCVLHNPNDTKKYLQSQLQSYPHEVFACLHLNNQHHVIEFEVLSTGTIDSASVHPREVVKSVLKHNAAAVIFAHNHPSGVTEPSQSDIAITKRLVDALKLIDVRVLDHFIIGQNTTQSFAEMGLI